MPFRLICTARLSTTGEPLGNFDSWNFCGAIGRWRLEQYRSRRGALHGGRDAQDDRFKHGRDCTATLSALTRSRPVFTCIRVGKGSSDLRTAHGSPSRLPGTSGCIACATVSNRKSHSMGIRTVVRSGPRTSAGFRSSGGMVTCTGWPMTEAVRLRRSSPDPR